MVYRKRKELDLIKLFIYIMGVLLICSGLFLAYIVYKRTILATQPQIDTPLAHCHTIKTGHMPTVQLNGEPVNSSINGTKVTLLVKNHDRYELVIVDYCQGTTTTIKPIIATNFVSKAEP